MCGREKKLVVL